MVEEEKVKKTKFETSYIPNGFRLGNGDGYYFSVISIEPLTNVQDMIFNIPGRPEGSWTFGTSCFEFEDCSKYKYEHKLHLHRIQF